jgi:hypothetical protein
MPILCPCAPVGRGDLASFVAVRTSDGKIVSPPVRLALVAVLLVGLLTAGALALVLSRDGDSSAEVLPCRAADMSLDDKLLFEPLGGFADGRIWVVNDGRAECSVSGTPRVELIDRRGKVLVVATPKASRIPKESAGPIVRGNIVLGHDEAAFVGLTWSNWCGDSSHRLGPTAPLPAALRLILPENRGHLDAEVEAGPPCGVADAPSRLEVEPFVQLNYPGRPAQVQSSTTLPSKSVR